MKTHSEYTVKEHAEWVVAQREAAIALTKANNDLRQAEIFAMPWKHGSVAVIVDGIAVTLERKPSGQWTYVLGKVLS